MKTNELHAKSIVELNQELASLLRELFNLRMQRGAGTKPRPSSFRDVRRNVARVKTILREKLEKK